MISLNIRKFIFSALLLVSIIMAGYSYYNYKVGKYSQLLYFYGFILLTFGEIGFLIVLVTQQPILIIYISSLVSGIAGALLVTKGGIKEKDKRRMGY